MTLTKKLPFRQISACGPAPAGCALAVADRATPSELQAWRTAFRAQRKDSRYYEIVEETICPDFNFRYFLIQDENGRTQAVQPFFILDQDVLAGLEPALAKACRKNPADLAAVLCSSGL